MSDSGQYKYVIEYIPNDISVKSDVNYLSGITLNNINIEDIIFMDQNTSYIREYNHWYKLNNSDVTASNSNVPSLPKSCTIRLYFPDFSVDTYSKNHKYALTLSTWICGKTIILGNYIISRVDALACPTETTFFNEKYYEYIDLNIVDPVSLIYSDEWSEWRRNVCGEANDPDTINSVGSCLYCSLHPVMEVEEEYLKLDGYVGGQSSVNLFEHGKEFLNLNISTNIARSLENCIESPAFELNINFNNIYKGSLKEYLLETYGINDCILKYELIISDGEDVYTMLTSPELGPETTTYVFTKEELEGFENGSGWKPGINVIGSVEIISDEESIITLLSNRLPLSENIVRYFIKTDFYDKFGHKINNVNLESVNMDFLNINVVNKTENKIIKIDRPGDNKANIYQTVFYRATDASSIVIHPEINENISINLDQYKHLVSSFILQIEGIKFVEIGRLKTGVIFKIIGSKLPKKLTRGQYYILNQDYDMVTSGKYIYES